MEIISTIVWMFFLFAVIALVITFGLGVLAFYIKVRIAKSALDSKIKPKHQKAVYGAVESFFKSKKQGSKEQAAEKGYNVRLTPQRIMNKSEESVFFGIKELMDENKVGGYLFSQVSYGEIIACQGEDSFAALQTFNSKRADFLITDTSFNPLVVVEYHGEGHFKGADMTKSDKVKSDICSAARINHLVIHFREKGRLSQYLNDNLLPLLT